ncbi:MAG: sulfotransferase, partial [Gammaproteobacteria bacterium]|nr:sulfotransferase [Gammaproteobacteria bacterium]
MEKLYDEIDHASKEGIVLCFALAKVYDDLGDVDRCFALLTEGNHHHKAGKTDTIEDARATAHGVRQIFARRTVKPLSPVEDCQPLFIVGMPRSGTTLVEQILASHSAVYGGGELKLMGQWCYGYLKLFKEYGDAAPLNNYLPQLREHYLKGIAELTSKHFVTDKMPVNFFWLGFILAALPNARIIHTVRDPMAVCWSIFKTPFAGSSNGFSCDLRDIGAFFTIYRELMAFWNDKYRHNIYSLHYESLTRHQQQETADLLEFCGLTWEDACLEFHENPRKVNTASKQQVRQPMYQDSSDA